MIFRTRPSGLNSATVRWASAALIATVFALVGGATSAVASEAITSFKTTMSTNRVGAHPDLETFFELEAPGAPEAAQNVIFDAPTGVFGNPRAVVQCSSSDFALDQCPASSQVGLITLRAAYRNHPHYLLGTAPLFMMVPEEGETARFSFIVPVLHIPIAIPVQVRTTTDYGLRFTVKDISELTPLSSAKLTFWGFPADQSHEAERFPKGNRATRQAASKKKEPPVMPIPPRARRTQTSP